MCEVFETENRITESSLSEINFPNYSSNANFVSYFDYFRNKQNYLKFFYVDFRHVLLFKLNCLEYNAKFLRSIVLFDKETILKFYMMYDLITKWKFRQRNKKQFKI